MAGAEAALPARRSHRDAAIDGFGARNPPSVLVAVGTDHYAFDRLVGWIDRWLADGASQRVTCLVQHGSGAAPKQAAARDFLTYPEIRAAISGASVVVTHAGPGTISLCTSMEKKPIVVPRRRQYGEVVDDHQLLFGRRLAERGDIDIAESEDALRLALELHLTDGQRTPPVIQHDRGRRATERFEELVASLLGAARGKG